jgi:hypothetical protein
MSRNLTRRPGKQEPPIESRGKQIDEYYTIKDDTHDLELSFEEFIVDLQNSESSICVRFESAEGGHYVLHRGDGKFQAVYAGPHGPENRPASIDEKNIQRLFAHADRIDYIRPEDSPFTDIEVAVCHGRENS